MKHSWIEAGWAYLIHLVLNRLTGDIVRTRGYVQLVNGFFERPLCAVNESNGINNRKV
jgi:hypothetical protein